MDRPDIKNAVCQLSTHFGAATIRDEANVKRVLRYLVGNPLRDTVEGCTLDVPAAAGAPLGSVLVMTDADWAGNVKDRTSLYWKKPCGSRAQLCGIRADGSGGRRV